MPHLLLVPHRRSTFRNAYKGRHVWLNFDGINYSADVWVNGVAGRRRLAAPSSAASSTSPRTCKPGKQAVVAVLVSPQPHPGVPHEHTLRDGMGRNGGITAIDGPTFLSTIGWDWLPAIRDRDTGIWQKVFLSATGPVVVKNPLVTTDLPLPRTDSADVAVQATVENVTDKPQKASLQGSIENIAFEQPVELAPHSYAARHLRRQKHARAAHRASAPVVAQRLRPAESLPAPSRASTSGNDVSDAQDVDFGVRKITYSVPGTDTLTISVNGVPVFIRGGDWGLDEAMKRIPRERLDAEIHLHQLANLNLIRNWVGQSTGEDFYELCDKYGILVWDEFFQPNPSDGPNPTDIPTYIANVRDKILRFRNHPSIALWCARNEGYPAAGDRRRSCASCWPSSSPRAAISPAPPTAPACARTARTHWRAPREFYTVTDDFFKTETGSVSVPTLESIHGMMPKKDWETINDDWAEHDFAKGNSGGDKYTRRNRRALRQIPQPGRLRAQGAAGQLRGLPRHVRRPQRAALPSHHGRHHLDEQPRAAQLCLADLPLRPGAHASFFAVMHASELVHIQFNQATDDVQVINNLPQPLTDAAAHVAIYQPRRLARLRARRQSDRRAGRGHQPRRRRFSGTASPRFISSSSICATPQGKLHLDQLLLARRARRSRRSHRPQPVAHGHARRQAESERSRDGQAPRDASRCTIPPQNIALMAHVQLRRKSGERVLPVFYSDNYVSLVPGESKTITIEAAASDFKGEDALIVVDGWNVTVAPASFPAVSIKPNLEAQPDRSPATGLPFATTGLR